MTFFLRFLLLFELLSFLTSFPRISLASNFLDTGRMVEDIQTLSHSTFGGRQTGTIHDLRGAEFVSARFQALNLLPAGIEPLGPLSKSWGQTRSLSVITIQTPTTVQLSIGHGTGAPLSSRLQLKSDYLPVLDSPSVNTTAPVVFVGYGIADPARGWDEYEGIDVRDRVVMFLRGKPPHYPVHIQHAEKEHHAREKGAVAFITLTGPLLDQYAARRGMGFQPLAFYTNAQPQRPLPGVWLSTKAVENIFQAQGLSLKDIQKTLNQERVIQSQPLQAIIHMKWETTHQFGSLMNVLGMIPGHDPRLKHETLIIGAHRDHFGTQAGLLFPGADDNASGTAVLLEIARVLATDHPPKRTILFISFSGEEQNLLGSRWYVHHPMRSLQKTVAMINVDHVGIGNGELTVGVSNMAKEIVAQAVQQVGLSQKIKLYGFFPGGDHVPFAKAGIPTIAVVTAGRHPHFHQSSDTADTIQPDALNTAARFVLALAQQLANSD